MAWILRLIDRPKVEGRTSGRKLYLAHCGSCHRADLKGTPPDFPSLADAGDKYSVAEVRTVIREGRGRMPAFGQLSREEIRAIVTYVLTGEDEVADASAAASPWPFGLKYTIDGYNKFLDPDGYPAVAPPWGTLNAINLDTGEIAWKVPFGEFPELVEKGIRNTGSENYGGPVVTAGGLVFIGATDHDRKFHAFDKANGKLLWETTLPAGGNATPATYEAGGRQFVVIAAGGGKSGRPSGGSYVAFALPEESKAEQPQKRQVAITIDDLPLGGGDHAACDLEYVRRVTAQLLAPFAEEKIPVTGFVNAGRCQMSAENLQQILGMWLNVGADLGNHTYSHADLNRVPVATFEEEILRGEPAIRQVLTARGRQLRYFRHPYLHAGRDLATKKAIEDFLAAHEYRVAPVTLDNSDYMFAAVYADARSRGDLELAQRAKSAYVPYLESVIAFFEGRSREVAGHDFPQILLLHANQLNAECMPALIQVLRSRGYEFVTLDRALEDDAYKMPDLYAGPGGFSWIHRWSITRHMKPSGEPDEPEFIAKGFHKIQQKP